MMARRLRRLCFAGPTLIPKSWSSYLLIVLSNLPQLAVLAATAIDARRSYHRVARSLARYASATSRLCITPSDRDLVAAILAIFGTLADSEPGSRALHRVGDCVINLFLYRALRGPTVCHDILQPTDAALGGMFRYRIVVALCGFANPRSRKYSTHHFANGGAMGGYTLGATRLVFGATIPACLSSGVELLRPRPVAASVQPAI